MTPVESSPLLVPPSPGRQVGVAGADSPAEPCPGSQGKLCVREEGETGAISPCHQGRQRGQEDRWDQSDHGRHLCQEHHQHLWDQHPPKDTGKPETSGVAKEATFSTLLVSGTPPSLRLPCPTTAKDTRPFRGKMHVWGFQGKTWVPSLGQKDPLEKETATHSNILAWEIPWIEEPGELQSRGWKESDTAERLTL